MSQELFFPNSVRIVVETPSYRELQSALFTISKLESIHFGPDPKGVNGLLPSLAEQFARPTTANRTRHVSETKTPAPNPYYEGTSGTVDWSRADHNPTHDRHRKLSAKEAKKASKK